MEWWNNLSCSFFSPEWSDFSWEIFHLPFLEKKYIWYDDWTQSFSRDVEIDFVQEIIDSLEINPRRIHLRGLSCVESVEQIASYYQDHWYEDKIAKNYLLPSDVLLTVSISLRHLLWCEKDKEFLSQRDANDQPYYAITPPLRTPKDLRIIQQAARSWIISGIEVFPGDEWFISQIFEKQILTPFQATQLLYYTWCNYWFTWKKQDILIAFPDFLSTLLSSVEEERETY